MKLRRWSERELDTLRRLYPDTPTADIARQLGRALSATYGQARRLGLEKSAAYLASPASGRLRQGDTRGMSGRFYAGQAAWNKGRSYDAGGRSAETRFRKGQKPHNAVPVGSYRVNADGYLDRKVSDTGYTPRDWTAVHRLVWIEAHGPIPEGHIVTFRPGRRTTDLAKITADAIELVSRVDLMKRNTVHNYPKPIALAVQLRGALVRRINRMEKAK